MHYLNNEQWCRLLYALRRRASRRIARQTFLTAARCFTFRRRRWFWLTPSWWISRGSFVYGARCVRFFWCNSKTMKNHNVRRSVEAKGTGPFWSNFRSKTVKDFRKNLYFISAWRHLQHQIFFGFLAFQSYGWSLRPLHFQNQAGCRWAVSRRGRCVLEVQAEIQWWNGRRPVGLLEALHQWPWFQICAFGRPILRTGFPGVCPTIKLRSFCSCLFPGGVGSAPKAVRLLAAEHLTVWLRVSSWSGQLWVVGAQQWKPGRRSMQKLPFFCLRKKLCCLVLGVFAWFARILLANRWWKADSSVAVLGSSGMLAGRWRHNHIKRSIYYTLDCSSDVKEMNSETTRRHVQNVSQCPPCCIPRILS